MAVKLAAVPFPSCVELLPLPAHVLTAPGFRFSVVSKGFTTGRPEIEGPFEFDAGVFPF
jgi:hypothetical protein